LGLKFNLKNPVGEDRIPIEAYNTSDKHTPDKEDEEEEE